MGGISTGRQHAPSSLFFFFTSGRFLQEEATRTVHIETHRQHAVVLKLTRTRQVVNAARLWQQSFLFLLEIDSFYIFLREEKIPINNGNWNNYSPLSSLKGLSREGQSTCFYPSLCIRYYGDDRPNMERRVDDAFQNARWIESAGRAMRTEKPVLPKDSARCRLV